MGKYINRKNLVGVHTFVALVIVFLASLYQAISPYTYIAIFFFYLGAMNLVTNNRNLIPTAGSLLLAIAIYLFGVSI
ncbi:hypothetical protein [Sediminibacillus albus]|uniref:Uncharacterized protein n=1 Tax=Sediminibacillus albus TaxID=407036 RepID=A0A1G8WUS0_9BACI|nr:hypothetical protein [Sediminibacillus albus]SDJ81375.1 hypothetical protein SAMN05216243_0980 [Sediminibacillus albus]